MNVYLLALVGIIYAYVAFNYYGNGRTGMALAFTAYALANLGFMIDSLNG